MTTAAQEEEDRLRAFLQDEELQQKKRAASCGTCGGRAFIVEICTNCGIRKEVARHSASIVSTVIDLLDAIDQSAHGRLPERLSKACVAARAAIGLPPAYVDSRGVPLATRTECRICANPVVSADGYRKVRGVWICKGCCDALGCRTLTDRGVSPLTDVDLASVNMSDLTEPAGPPRLFTIRRRGAVVWQGEATSLEDAIGKALTNREPTRVACTSLPLQQQRTYLDPRGVPLDELPSDRVALLDVSPLATQIAFAVNESIEDDVERIDGIAEDMPTPPTRWSPLRAMAFWDHLPESAKTAWVAYARKVSIYAGLNAPSVPTSEATSTSEAGGPDAPKVCPK